MPFLTFLFLKRVKHLYYILNCLEPLKAVGSTTFAWWFPSPLRLLIVLSKQCFLEYTSTCLKKKKSIDSVAQLEISIFHAGYIYGQKANNERVTKRIRDIWKLFNTYNCVFLSKSTIKDWKFIQSPLKLTESFSII